MLKPVQAAHLAQTVQRLQSWWAQCHPAQWLEQQQLQPASAAPLQFIQASVGSQIHIVRLQDVIYLEAAEKYLRVLTAQQEYLIRTPLKDLQSQLDSTQFWQIHRGCVVHAASIASVQKDDAGRLWLQLRQRAERLAVSRLYATRFKAM